MVMLIYLYYTLIAEGHLTNDCFNWQSRESETGDKQQMITALNLVDVLQQSTLTNVFDSAPELYFHFPIRLKLLI